jgi:hypothetical protein
MRIQKFHSSARGFLALGALALLAACNINSNPTPPPPPTPPTNGSTIKALMHGPVQSAFLEPLKATMSMTQYDGTQKPEDYDLVILDGDAHAPADLKGDPVVAQALASGKWVLGVDLTAAHKRGGLGDILHAATCGNSPAYAMRQSRDAYGRLEVRVVEYPTPRDPVVVRGGGPTSGPPAPNPPRPPLPTPPNCDGGPAVASASPGISAQSASLFVKALQKRVSAKAPAQAQDLPSNIPQGLLYVNYYFDLVVPWTTGKANRVNSSQNPSIEAHYQFTVYLNNQNNPQGDFQYILQDYDASANPNGGTGTNVAINHRDGTDWVQGTYDEQGWFQDSLKTYTLPRNTDWSTLATSPETVNGSTNVTTGVSFSIGFDGVGGVGSYSYSNSVSRDISDWKVDNQSANAAASWHYRTNNPVDADQAYLCNDYSHPPIFNNPYSGCYLTHTPNNLSLNTLQIHTQSVWKTPKVETDWVHIWGVTTHSMADIYCYENAGLYCGNNQFTLDINSQAQQVFEINMGAVLPIPLTAMTFSPNPVTAGQTVTGTITLTRAAQVDTDLALTSSSPNATVLPKVTVKQGQTSANFQVLTNANGLTPGDKTVATFTATGIQGQQLQSQLTVQNIGVASLTFQPNPIRAGRPTTGTLTLASAAQTDTDIGLAWNSPSVPSPTKVTVKQGQTSVNFPVQTIPSGVPFGGSIIVTPTAGGIQGQLTLKGGPPPLLSAGQSSTCALKINTTVVCWGDNTYGQLNVPAGLSGVQQIGAGGYYVCALKTNGTVVCWGDNSLGQLNLPAGLSGVSQISSGFGFSCALKIDTTVVCWGDNTKGQATPPAGLSTVQQIAAGGYHACALKTDRSVVCWGDNSLGQLNLPAGLSGAAAQLSAGRAVSCALKTDGTAVCWGDNTWGQLNVPAGLSGVQQIGIATGPLPGLGDTAATSCALRSDGTVTCWGTNPLGQGTVPAGLSGVQQIGLGLAQTCAAKTDETVVFWGTDLQGAATPPAGLNLIQ